MHGIRVSFDTVSIPSICLMKSVRTLISCTSLQYTKLEDFTPLNAIRYYIHTVCNLLFRHKSLFDANMLSLRFLLELTGLILLTLFSLLRFGTVHREINP